MNSTVNKTFYTFYRIDVLKVRENFQERGKFPLSGGWEGGGGWGWGSSEILLGEGREFFLPVGENLRRSDFGDSNPFQS